jgi:hypothetical protein
MRSTISKSKKQRFSFSQHQNNSQMLGNHGIQLRPRERYRPAQPVIEGSVSLFRLAQAVQV